MVGLPSRKGVFLTFIAVLMVTLLLLYASTQYEVSYRDTVPTETLRVTGLNSFITDFEETYLERALFASGHRALAAMINATPDGAGGSRLDGRDVNKEFQEAMLNATINDGAILLPAMVNHTLPIWIGRLSNFSRDNLHADLDFNITAVNITQDEMTGPWLVNVTLSLGYRVNATDTLWERENITVVTTFDIFGFEDPYLKSRTKNINRTIQRFNFTGENYQPENITDLITTKTFIYDKKAPSFLQRFKAVSAGVESGCCGIFSLVSEQQEPPESLSFILSDRTYADFTYLGNFCFDQQLYTVNGVSGAAGIGRFYLDEYFVDKVFGLPPDDTQESNSPPPEGTDTCGS